MQNDFVLLDKYSKTLCKDIEKVMERGYNDLNNEVVDTSDITQCDKRICYKIFDSGTNQSLNQSLHHKYLVEKWVYILSKAKGIEVTGKFLVLADHSYNVFANVDISGRINDVSTIFMIKEVDNTFFTSEKTKRKDVVNLIAQMWISEVNDGFLIYENNVNKEFNIFHIVNNTFVLNAIKDKLKSLNNSKIQGTLPKRKYKSHDAEECCGCLYRGKCWSL